MKLWQILSEPENWNWSVIWAIIGAGAFIIKGRKQPTTLGQLYLDLFGGAALTLATFRDAAHLTGGSEGIAAVVVMAFGAGIMHVIRSIVEDREEFMRLLYATLRLKREGSEKGKDGQ